MATKARIYLEYKYKDRPWMLFDWTQVKKWADVQEERMRREHPDAEHRRRSK